MESGPFQWWSRAKMKGVRGRKTACHDVRLGCVRLCVLTGEHVCVCVCVCVCMCLTHPYDVQSALRVGISEPDSFAEHGHITAGQDGHFTLSLASATHIPSQN